MAPQGQVMQLVNTVNGPMLVPEGPQTIGQLHQFQHLAMDGKSPSKSSLLPEPPKLMSPTMQNQHLNPILMSPGTKLLFAKFDYFHRVHLINYVMQILHRRSFQSMCKSQTGLVFGQVGCVWFTDVRLRSVFKRQIACSNVQFVIQPNATEQDRHRVWFKSPQNFRIPSSRELGIRRNSVIGRDSNPGRLGVVHALTSRPRRLPSQDVFTLYNFCQFILSINFV